MSIGRIKYGFLFSGCLLESEKWNPYLHAAWAKPSWYGLRIRGSLFQIEVEAVGLQRIAVIAQRLFRDRISIVADQAVKTEQLNSPVSRKTLLSFRSRGLPSAEAIGFK